MAKKDDETKPEEEVVPETPPEEAEAEDASAPEAPRASDTDEEAAAPDASDASDADASPEPEAAEEPAAEAEPAAEEPDAAAEAEPASPKARRRRARAAKFAAQPTRPQMSSDERQAERDEARKRRGAIRRGRRQREREKRRAGRSGATPEPIAARPVVRPRTQKTRQGVVVSDRAAKTITVRIDITRRHPEYKKVVRTSSTLHAHDENSEAHIGDTVVVRECRPLSRTKRWRLVEVVERAK